MEHCSATPLGQWALSTTGQRPSILALLTECTVRIQALDDQALRLDRAGQGDAALAARQLIEQFYQLLALSMPAMPRADS